MNFIRPNTDILPPAQQALWPTLKTLEQGFVLYGGTAIALHFGHRQSIDFDFFSSVAFDPEQLKARYDFLDRGETIQLASNTLSVLSPTPHGEVKVSFFGGLSFGRVATPFICEGSFIRLASPLDLAVQKLKVIQVRSESKDYYDLDCLFQNGVQLGEALGAAKALYRDFPVAIALRALCYFEEGDVATLPLSIQARLVASVEAFTAVLPCARESALLDISVEQLQSLANRSELS